MSLDVVLVDADPLRWRALSTLLTRAGCTVVGAASRAAESVQVARSLSPDVVVIDLAMAGERGLALIDDLHAAAPGVAVIVVSPLDSLRLEIIEAGAFAMVPDDDLRGLVVAVDELRRPRVVADR